MCMYIYLFGLYFWTKVSFRSFISTWYISLTHKMICKKLKCFMLDACLLCELAGKRKKTLYFKYSAKVKFQRVNKQTWHMYYRLNCIYSRIWDPNDTCIQQTLEEFCIKNAVEFILKSDFMPQVCVINCCAKQISQLWSNQYYNGANTFLVPWDHCCIPFGCRGKKFSSNYLQRCEL